MRTFKISTTSGSYSDTHSAMDRHRYFSLSLLTLLILSSSCFAENGFNPAFLEHLGGSSEVADLSAFNSKDGGQLPGKYTVDIYINGDIVDHREIEFVKNDNAVKDDTGLRPCISLEQMKKYGIKTDAINPLLLNKSAAADAVPATAAVVNNAGACEDFVQLIPSASTVFNFENQKLDISIPQAMMSSTARGYVDPSLWDNGINALLMNYNFSGASATNTGGQGDSRDNSYYLNLRSGLNLGAWRLRNYSTWNDNNGIRDFQNVNTYLQRSVVSLKSLLTLGDSYSPSDVFDSNQFRGVQMASDDDMLPDSEKGFAPIIRGIAKTNAQVTIRQNGYIIYQSYVAPGAFEISDLYPSASSGDMTVTIKEQDGSEQSFVQPYASVPVLQREGRTKYSLTAGQYRNGYGSDTPEFGQFTLIRGFSKGITLYGGTQASENYASAALGYGQNLGDIGAISVDITQAKTEMPAGAQSKGQSYRMLYAKSFAGTGTDFRLMGYRYSTGGFYTLQESVDLNSQNSFYTTYNTDEHKRSKMEGAVNQTLGENWGSLYFSASMQDYWGTSGKEKTLQWGYSNSWQSVSYNVAYSDTSMGGESHDRQLSVNFSVPLDRFIKSATATYSINHSNDGQVYQQAGLSGTLLEDRNLSYSVSQNHGSQGQGNSGNANANYQGRYGNSNLGYSYSDNSRRVDYGLQGGIVAHSEGITLSQPLGETIALVAAPGANDTKVYNNQGVGTDYRGYAVVPYVSAYRHNNIGLETTSLSDNVELEESSLDVIPTRGAVVKAKFNTHVGYRVIMTLTRPGGKPVPFGTTITLQGDNPSSNGAGIVGEQGETFLSGLPEKGLLLAQWGKEDDQRCHINYQLNQQDLKNTMLVTAAICQPGGSDEKIK